MRRMGTTYDAFARDYAREAETGSYNALYDRPAVLGLCGEVAGMRVLDAACGAGVYIEELVRRGAEVVAFDASAEMVRIARERMGSAVEVRVHDLERPLDFAGDGDFDLVVLALALHYVDDRVGMLRELARVLAPGGALVVSTHHPMLDWVRLGGSYFDVEVVEESLNRSKDWPVRYWRRPLTSVTAEFREAGFLIDTLLEARPAPEMAQRDPTSFDRLSREPAFVFFRLVKR